LLGHHYSFSCSLYCNRIWNCQCIWKKYSSKSQTFDFFSSSRWSKGSHWRCCKKIWCWLVETQLKNLDSAIHFDSKKSWYY